MILVFGKTGQVGLQLSKFDKITNVGRHEVDLSDPAACAAFIRQKSPSAVINAAAYTQVDKAEEEQELASAINTQAPAAMAAECAVLGIPLVQISTDYVYDGTGLMPKKTTDATGPLNVYGKTKLAGEDAVRAANPIHAILRTSWVFSEHGNNFVKSMLRLGAERQELNIVADQIGGPTAAEDIAVACIALANHLIDDPRKSGTYNFSGKTDVSWADFAREIFRQANIDCTVNDISSSEYPTPAVRPKNSRMNCDGLTQVSIERPDWRVSLTKVLSKLDH